MEMIIIFIFKMLENWYVYQNYFKINVFMLSLYTFYIFIHLGLHTKCRGQRVIMNREV